MKALFITVLSLFAITLAKPAQASHHKHHYRHHASHHHHHRYARHNRQHSDDISTMHVVYNDPRPSAWCGFFMRQIMHVADTAYNLAANWQHWGRPASGPAPGVIGVMPHHVFRVVSVVAPGKVLAISGNDGHAVKTRVRSTRGVIAWREA